MLVIYIYNVTKRRLGNLNDYDLCNVTKRKLGNLNDYY